MVPLEWGRNQAGMSAGDVLTDAEAGGRAALARRRAMRRWRTRARCSELNVHKQVLNRVSNRFSGIRCRDLDRVGEFFRLALRARRAAGDPCGRADDARRARGEYPAGVAIGEWHLPLVQDDERSALPLETQKTISAARSGRVSYLTHEGVREIEKDVELYERRLKGERHLSPFEHVATPAQDAGFHANFRGWIQMRAEIESRLPAGVNGV